MRKFCFVKKKGSYRVKGRTGSLPGSLRTTPMVQREDDVQPRLPRRSTSKTRPGTDHGCPLTATKRHHVGVSKGRLSMSEVLLFSVLDAHGSYFGECSLEGKCV